jgi:hypothetical protein
MKTNWMKRFTVAGIMFLGMAAMSSPLAAAPRFAVGVGIGAPGFYAPPPVVAVRPPYPGPGYAWVDGYYGPNGVWIGGFWRRPGFAVRPYGFAPGFRGGYVRGFAGGRAYGFRR